MPSIFEIGVSSVHPAPGAELLFLHSILEVIRLGLGVVVYIFSISTHSGGQPGRHNESQPS